MNMENHAVSDIKEADYPRLINVAGSKGRANQNKIPLTKGGTI